MTEHSYSRCMGLRNRLPFATARSKQTSPSLPSLQLAALEALLEVAGAAPEGFAERYAPRLAWLRGFLLHTDAAGKTDAAVALLHARASQPDAPTPSACWSYRHLAWQHCAAPCAIK